MYAIVEIAGQQVKVTEKQKVIVNRLPAEEGEKVTFDSVLLLDANGTVSVGTPVIDGAAVEAKILTHLKGDKVLVFKKKRRKGYRVKNGHRQALTQISIESIVSSGAVKVSGKKEVRKTTVEPQTVTEMKNEPAVLLQPEKGSVPVSVAGNELESMTVTALRELAKEKGISGFSSMKKAELVAALTQV